MEEGTVELTEHEELAEKNLVRYYKNWFIDKNELKDSFKDKKGKHIDITRAHFMDRSRYTGDLLKEIRKTHR